MCDCTICKATDKLRTAGFDAWPKGELRPIPRNLKDKGYAAHWAHCGAEFYRKPVPAGSPFPCTGTPQSDPRIGYHFPGGQVGKVRREVGKKPWPRSSKHDPRPPATDDAAEYAASFAKSNHLT